jgi:hypothetical protein
MIRFVSILIVSVHFACAVAQTGRSFDSIEGLVGVSDVACFGRLSSVEPAGELDTKKYSRQFRVRFEITEKIRGEVGKSVEILLNDQFRGHYIQAMHDLKIEVMMTIAKQPSWDATYPLQEIDGKKVDDRKVFFRFITDLPKDSKHDIFPGYLVDNGRIFDVNLKPVSGRRQILNCSKAFQKKYPKQLETIWLRLPNDYLRKVGDPNAFGGIELPVCKETRSTILKLLKNPEFVLTDVSKETLFWERKTVLSMSLNALTPFQDKETLAVVKKFAKDGDPVTISEKKGYEVAEAAQRVLEYWATHPTGK